MSSHENVPFDVTSRHGQVSQRMEEYATHKVERLLRYNDQVSRIEIIVDGPHEAPEVEMRVHLDNASNLVARARSDRFNSAIDGLVDKMERQLVRAKEKLKHHKGDAGKGQDVNRQRPDNEESYEDIVRRNLGS